MSKKIIIITGAEPRHTFVRMALALQPNIQVVASYCESVRKFTQFQSNQMEPGTTLAERHIQARTLSEQDFFIPFTTLAPDQSNPEFIERGRINDTAIFQNIQELAPDLLVAFGCSILRDPLVSAFEGRFLNIHLGLSPYYRGAGTNFWPLVNNQPEYVGATFMHLDKGIDTGKVIHQIRARLFPHDTPHQIGNRLITDMVPICAKIIDLFDQLEPMEQLVIMEEERYYRTQDFSDQATKTLYHHFKQGLMEKALSQQERRETLVPILRHPRISKA